MNFDYGDRNPNAAAQLMAATRAVDVGWTTMVAVSVFVNHTPAHQGYQCHQPGQHRSLHCFHGPLVARTLPT
jgi:hypothetical protein